MEFSPELGVFMGVYGLAMLVACAFAWRRVRLGDADLPADRALVARNTRRVALTSTVGFLGIVGGLTYWQLLQASVVGARRDNPRTSIAELRQLRGRILDRNGAPLVTNAVQADGIVRRLYASAPLVHVTGFVNPRLGPSGIERSANLALTGQAIASDWSRFTDSLLHRERPGDDVVLTIDRELQRTAEQAFGGASGGLVLLDPRTGDVLALVSRPWFDPNDLTYDLDRAGFDEEATRAQRRWDQLRTDPAAPLLDRMTNSAYTPGSTFKTVTLAAALDLGVASVDDRFRFTLRPADRDHRVAWHENRFVSCQNHPQLSELTLTQAYAWSCNIVFSDLASAIGAERYITYARRFGLDSVVPFDLPVTASRLFTEPNYFGSAEGAYGLAATGMGQGKLAVTPLQMALVASAVAFNGVIQRPRLLRQLRAADGQVLEERRPASWQVATTALTADRVKAMMLQAVDEGWAARARVPGFQVGGKTGTAELGVADNPHSWFIGLAPVDAPRYAIAVIKENSGNGSEQAAPIAQQLLRAALPRDL